MIRHIGVLVIDKINILNLEYYKHFFILWILF